MRCGVLSTASSGFGAGRSARVILWRTPGVCWFQSVKAAWPVRTAPDCAESEAGMADAATVSVMIRISEARTREIVKLRMGVFSFKCEVLQLRLSDQSNFAATHFEFE